MRPNHIHIIIRLAALYPSDDLSKFFVGGFLTAHNIRNRHCSCIGFFRNLLIGHVVIIKKSLGFVKMYFRKNPEEVLIVKTLGESYA